MQKNHFRYLQRYGTNLQGFFTLFGFSTCLVILSNRAFSHDVTAAILVFQVDDETAAMLVYPENPLGVELFSHVNVFFCSNKLAQMLVTWVKTLYWGMQRKEWLLPQSGGHSFHAQWTTPFVTGAPCLVWKRFLIKMIIYRSKVWPKWRRILSTMLFGLCWRYSCQDGLFIVVWFRAWFKFCFVAINLVRLNCCPVQKRQQKTKLEPRNKKW